MGSGKSVYVRPYTDPAITGAMASIASMFAPPSSSELYGYAKAKETQDKTARLAELYAAANDPSFDQATFDRRGVAAGLYAPSQSYYSVDQGNLTSRSNNAADNARALQQTGMQQTGETTRALLAPVASGATRYVPPALADLYNIEPMQMGSISAGQGDTVYAPDGKIYNGAPKPKTESEVKGDLLAGLPKVIQDAIVFGSTPVETTRNPDGTAAPMTRPQLLDNGAVPIESGNAQTTNYTTPGGKTGIARYDPMRQTYVDVTTDLPVPPNSTMFSTAVQGDKSQTGVGLPTKTNVTDANKRKAEDTSALATLDLYETLIRNNPGVTGIVGAIRGTGQNAVAAASDLAAAFGDKAPGIKEAAAEVGAGLKGVAPELFDPAIPQADFLAGTLAYAIARTENPSGEVSRQAYDRAYERVRGGLLSNQSEILAKLNAYREVLKAKGAGTAALEDPSKARTDTGYQAPAGGETTTIETSAGPVTIKRVQ